MGSGSPNTDPRGYVNSGPGPLLPGAGLHPRLDRGTVPSGRGVPHSTQTSEPPRERSTCPATGLHQRQSLRRVGGSSARRQPGRGWMVVLAKEDPCPEHRRTCPSQYGHPNARRQSNGGWTEGTVARGVDQAARGDGALGAHRRAVGRETPVHSCLFGRTTPFGKPREANALGDNGVFPGTPFQSSRAPE